MIATIWGEKCSDHPRPILCGGQSFQSGSWQLFQPHFPPQLFQLHFYVHRYVLEIAREKLYWRGKYFLDTSPFCRPKQTKFCVQKLFLLTSTTTNQYKFRWLIMKRIDNLANKKSSLFKMSFKLVKQFSEFFKLFKFLFVLSHKRCKCSQAFSLCYFELKVF